MFLYLFLEIHLLLIVRLFIGSFLDQDVCTLNYYASNDEVLIDSGNCEDSID